MAKKQNQKKQSVAKQISHDEAIASGEVLMVFSEDKYYQDYNTPHFIKGQEYLIKGGDQIARWLKRGGQVVGGEIPTHEGEMPAHEVNESTTVDVAIHEEPVATEKAAEEKED